MTEFSIGFKFSLTCIVNWLNLKWKNISLGSFSKETNFKSFLAKQLLSFGVNRALDVERKVTYKNPTMNV